MFDAEHFQNEHPMERRGQSAQLGWIVVLLLASLPTMLFSKNVGIALWIVAAVLTAWLVARVAIYNGEHKDDQCPNP